MFTAIYLEDILPLNTDDVNTIFLNEITPIVDNHIHLKSPREKTLNKYQNLLLLISLINIS